MIEEPGGHDTFSRFFMTGMAFRIALTIGVMTAAYVGAGISTAVGTPEWRFVGALGGLALGVLVARSVKRRWDPLDRGQSS